MCLGHFNPRAPCGARLALGLGPSLSKNFNPRAPCGARPYHISRLCEIGRHFNPRAPCGARPNDSAFNTHPFHFNPRAPCGARHYLETTITDIDLFQSTRPVRGATLGYSAALSTFSFQSARPVRGATSSDPKQAGWGQNFNPRAPCGARRLRAVLAGHKEPFQSARPVRGATINIRSTTKKQLISIRAPRAGRD